MISATPKIITLLSFQFCQLKNMIAALYSSRPNGSKSFTLEDTAFGWETIQKVNNVIGNLFFVVKS